MEKIINLPTRGGFKNILSKLTSTSHKESSTYLLKAEINNYSLGGILVYFQRNDKLVWYPLAHLQHLKQAGAKSINCETSPEWGFEVEHTKKRVRLTIPFKNVLEAFEKHWQEVENGKAETS